MACLKRRTTCETCLIVRVCSSRLSLLPAPLSQFVRAHRMCHSSQRRRHCSRGVGRSHHASTTATFCSSLHALQQQKWSRSGGDTHERKAGFYRSCNRTALDDGLRHEVHGIPGAVQTAVSLRLDVKGRATLSPPTGMTSMCMF